MHGLYHFVSAINSAVGPSMNNIYLSCFVQTNSEQHVCLSDVFILVSNNSELSEPIQYGLSGGLQHLRHHILPLCLPLEGL